MQDGRTRHSVVGLSRALAEAYSPAHGFEGITCNAIAPGFVQTELTASVFANDALANALAARTIAGRNSIPSDLVGAAVFLGEDEGRGLAFCGRHGRRRARRRALHSAAAHCSKADRLPNVAS